MIEKNMNLNKIKLAIIGLGYVGLPLAVSFGSKRNVIAFDTSKKRIKELKNNIDSTKEIKTKKLANIKKIKFTDNTSDLKNCNCFIITVPTPVNKKNLPNFDNLISASKLVGQVLKEGDIVIYESTVYPGATKEVCVPILEKVSRLKYNKSFFIGYSPERINPGDKFHKLEKVIKITSGSNPKISKIVNNLYSSIITAGTHMAESIETAEAAKVIENTQRDLNIALVNELSMIFSKLNLNTKDILRAASTKWNFIPFKPGLVGGHCIGVDPFYLTYKSLKSGYNPKIILAGRKLNESMPKYISKKFIKIMKIKKLNFSNSKVLILGATFKENCPDIRNSKTLNLILELKKKYTIHIYDPFIKNMTFEKKHINFIKKPKLNYYDAIILSVPHKFFLNLGISKIKLWLKQKNVFFDIKNVFHKRYSDFQL